MRIATLKLLCTGALLLGVLTNQAQHETFIDGLVVDFPAKPTVETSEVPTDLGTIDMYTYMHEVSSEEVYMVAYSDYGKANLEGMDPYDLLEGGKEGALESLGVTNIYDEKEFKRNGNPALSFKGDNGTYYVRYVMLMVEDRLYQIAVLKIGSYSTDLSAERFLNKYRLEGSIGKPGLPPDNPSNDRAGQGGKPFPADLFKSEDGRFAIAFPGQPTKSSEIVNTEIGESLLEIYMYEKSAREVFMVSFNDYRGVDLDDIDGKDLLEGGRDGAMGSLGIDKVTGQSFFKKQGFDALYFTANNGQYFVRYEMILVGNRLYQIAVLADGDAPSGTDVERFFKTFRFKE